MPSARNATTTTLIVAAIGLSVANTAYINGMRSTASTPADFQGEAVLTEDLTFLTGDNATPAINLNLMAALTIQADGDLETGSGDVVSNLTRNPAACWKTTSGNFIECYQEDVFTGTGGGFGTASYYDVASIASPYTTPGAVTRVGYSCDGTPVAANVSAGYVTALTSSATTFFSRAAISSGSHLYVTGTGSNNNGESTAWDPQEYIKISASTDIGMDDD